MSIFRDFKKAFDTIDFSILLKRLRCLGIKDDCFKWFESYLNGRFLRVILDCSISKCYPITCGIPQGSVLGPLLYLIYCDSMRFYIPRAKITSFADDTALTVTGKTLNELTDNANEALKGLLTFVSLSWLAINTTKTNFMTFTRIGTALGKISLRSRERKLLRLAQQY